MEMCKHCRAILEPGVPHQCELTGRPAFDLELGEALRDMGMARAASAKEDALELGRALCRKAALKRHDRTATVDDATRGFLEYGLPATLLGNAAGSLFKGGGWVFVGYTKSKRVTNHAHTVMIWRLENHAAAA